MALSEGQPDINREGVVILSSDGPSTDGLVELGHNFSSLDSQRRSRPLHLLAYLG